MTSLHRNWMLVVLLWTDINTFDNIRIEITTGKQKCLVLLRFSVKLLLYG